MKLHNLHFAIDALGDRNEALPDAGEAEGGFVTDPGKEIGKHNSYNVG